MSDPLIVFSQKDFGYGLYTKKGDLVAPANSARRLQNAMVHLGGFRKLYGSTKLNTVKIGDYPIISQYKGYKGVDTVHLAVAQTAGTALSTTIFFNKAGTWTALAGGTGFTNDARWSFITYNGVIYGTNGVVFKKINIPATTNPLTTPTVSAATGPATVCKHLVLAGGRVWALGNNTYPDQAYFCAVNSSGIALPESWSATDYFPFPDEASDERIINGCEWDNKLLVLTDNTVSILSGNNMTEFAIQTVEHGRGCMAEWSLSKLGKDPIWFSRKGFCVFTGAVHNLSDDIPTFIDDINKTYKANIVAECDDEQYYASYTSVSGTLAINDAMLCFDTRLEAVQDSVIKGGWTGPHTIGAASMCFYKGYADNGEMYYGDATSTGFVHKFMDSTAKSFSGASMVTQIDTFGICYPNYGGVKYKKFLEEAIMIAEPEGNYNWEIYHAIDNASSYTQTLLNTHTINLATNGMAHGDRDQTLENRTLIVFPAKFQSNPVCYYTKLRFEQTGTACAGIVREIGLSASMPFPERR